MADNYCRQRAHSFVVVVVVHWCMGHREARTRYSLYWSFLVCTDTFVLAMDGVRPDVELLAMLPPLDRMDKVVANCAYFECWSSSHSCCKHMWSCWAAEIVTAVVHDVEDNRFVAADKRLTCFWWSHVCR